jgi:hypothetical protein
LYLNLYLKLKLALKLNLDLNWRNFTTDASETTTSRSLPLGAAFSDASEFQCQIFGFRI